MKTFHLPFPPQVLNPNKKTHWGAKHRAAQKYRSDATILARAAGKPRIENGVIHIEITFCPPDNRKRDDDNMIAAFKSGRDGLADAWGVDDNIFRPLYPKGKVMKGGCVVVSYEEAGA